MGRSLLAAAFGAALLVVAAAPAMAGTMVFNIDVTSAQGVGGFTPFSFQETFTLAPGVASGTTNSGDYSGNFTDTGTPVTAALKAGLDLTGASSFSTYDLGYFAPGPVFVQGDLFENIFNANGAYNQSISAFGMAGGAPNLDEAGLAAFFSAQGPMDWYERVQDNNFNVIAGYTGTATLASFSGGAAAAPEPGAWALMLLGFGTVGMALRRRTGPATA